MATSADKSGTSILYSNSPISYLYILGSKMIYFITGHAGTGKTSASKLIRDTLYQNGRDVICIDGDHIRKCWPHLKYNQEQRSASLSRVLRMTLGLQLECDDIIVSVVAPIAEAREDFHSLLAGHLIELRLTKVHKRRPESYYCEYEESKHCTPHYQGEAGLKEILEGIYEDNRHDID